MRDLNHLSLVLLASIFVAAGCSSIRPVASTLQVTDVPQVGTPAEAELGTALLEQAHLRSTPALSLENTVFAVGKPNIKFQAAIYRIQGENKSWLYFGRGTECLLALSKKDSNCLRMRALDGTFELEPAPKFRLTHAPLSAGYRQELLYNGRTGQIVRFTYREFKDDMARPAFFQDIQYDLSQGNVVGFKGARLEVMAATNSKIIYRVLKTFDPLEQVAR